MGYLIGGGASGQNKTARVMSKGQLSSEADVESLPHFGRDQTSAGELDDRSSRHSPLLPNRFSFEQTFQEKSATLRREKNGLQSLKVDLKRSAAPPVESINLNGSSSGKQLEKEFRSKIPTPRKHVKKNDSTNPSIFNGKSPNRS